MAQYERNAGKRWTPTEVAKLRELAAQNTPTRVIGLKLGRPVAGDPCRGIALSTVATSLTFPTLLLEKASASNYLLPA